MLFLLFFISGFCSLVYQVVWTRLAFASFGIITPVLSVVISVFMLGLALGSWLAGRGVASWTRGTGLSAAAFYAAAEAIIGLGAFAVPWLFAWGERLLLASGQADSFGYLALSAGILAVSLLPWCLCMGMTFPLMMAYAREHDAAQSRSFSYLYLANVLGAMSGTFLTAVVLVEALGFARTLAAAAIGNFFIALAAAWLSLRRRGECAAPDAALAAPRVGRFSGELLFATGFCAMAMEVVWSHSFTPVLKTQVYSFAAVVFVYLGATFCGSLAYRRQLRRGALLSTAQLLALAAISAGFPIVVNDPLFLAADIGGSIHLRSAIILLSGIIPLCAVLGYLTPSLIDGCSGGDPAVAGRAYAVNVLGCILGPLFASYALLPWLSGRAALIVLGLPFAVFYVGRCGDLVRWQRRAFGAALAAVLFQGCFFSRDFEEFWPRLFPKSEVRRDYAACVIAMANERQAHLLVNGVGMTVLTPITKFMAHLPLAFHEGRPRAALVVCFGMGTTYRSALSWGVKTTAVELVPGVRDVFGFYHRDAALVLRNPLGRVVIDDGRRYLRRVPDKFDAIVIDPPPPVEAAGSSLLYSREFYELAKAHLNPGGIVQAWFPGGEAATGQAVVRALTDSFPHVRCFASVSGWGIHLLASMEPIVTPSARALAARLPPPARADLLAWSGGQKLSDYLNRVLAREIPIATLLNSDARVSVTDDRPFNEYFLLRRRGWAF